MAKRPLILPRERTNRQERLEPLPSFDAVLEVSKERAEKLKLLKAAILRHDTPEVYRIAGSLCGLGDNYEEGD